MISSGAGSEDEIGRRCDAGTGCGGCREWICEMLAAARAGREGLAARTA